MAGPYTEDEGVDFRVYTGIDITGYSAIVCKVKKPNATTTIWTMIADDVTNGILRYITSTTAKDLDGQVGTWTLQPKITLATGEVFHGLEVTFTVTEVVGGT